MQWLMLDSRIVDLRMVLSVAVLLVKNPRKCLRVHSPSRSKSCNSQCNQVATPIPVAVVSRPPDGDGGAWRPSRRLVHDRCGECTLREEREGSVKPGKARWSGSIRRLLGSGI